MNRLDWVTFWERYDAKVDELRARGAYLYTYNQTSQARVLIQDLVETMIAEREGALS